MTRNVTDRPDLVVHPAAGELRYRPRIAGTTRYEEEYAERIVEFMSQGLSLTAAAAELGIHRNRILEWSAIYPDLAEAVALGKSMRQLYLERASLSPDSNPALTIFALKNAGQGDWRVDQQIEHSGPEGGPIKIDNKMEIVLVRPKPQVE